MAGAGAEFWFFSPLSLMATPIIPPINPKIKYIIEARNAPIIIIIVVKIPDSPMKAMGATYAATAVDIVFPVTSTITIRVI
jgi:hypothetical protein